MIQTLIHTPIDCLIALLSLVALIFIIDRLGFLAWIAWVNRHQNKRHEGKPKNSDSKEYWRVHP
jgi:hypothetical protein